MKKLALLPKRIGRLCRALLGIFFFYFAGVVPALADARPESVGFWYAASPPLEELSQYDWVVLEPGHVSAEQINKLRELGSQPFAYLSVGEKDGGVDAYLQTAASAVRNEAWDSHVMLLSQPGWRAYLLKRAGELSKAGYSGLFLDTLDSFQLLPEEQREQERLALRDFLRELHQQYPQMKLFFNRGFEVLPELSGVASAVAIESIYSGWNAAQQAYVSVPEADREWLSLQLSPLKTQGVPVVAIEYLPAHKREEAKALVKKLVSEGFIPLVTTPDLDSVGTGPVAVQPRRIAVIYDPREGDLTLTSGHIYLGGLLEYLGYRVDYFKSEELPLSPKHISDLYAGVVVWMRSGPPVKNQAFYTWLHARLDEQVPIAFFEGIPISNEALLSRFGMEIVPPAQGGAQVVEHDASMLGSFEAPVKARSRDLLRMRSRANSTNTAHLVLKDTAGERLEPVVTGNWGGIAMAPYVLEEGQGERRWILDPFAFIQKSLKLTPMPRPDTTTENGRRIATVHIDGDGFPSKAEVAGSPYSGEIVLRDFIQANPFLTSVSIIEGEVAKTGKYPELTPVLEPLARRILADKKVEVASHSYSHPFFWRPELVQQREGFEATYGMMMDIPGYKKVDFRREVFGARDYINRVLTTPDKPVKMMFWSGDALPDGNTIGLAYEAGLMNVNGGVTHLTRAQPSLTGLYPLIRPTSGGLQYYAPIINENVYTNLWEGPYYGFRDLVETFELTDSPRRLRGLHLYYHFYSGTKQASIRAMDEIYKHMQAQQPLSLWMSDYIPRVHGLYQASLGLNQDGSWRIRGLDKLRTVRLDKDMGWPDLRRSQGVAGVRDLPQGRYVHLSQDHATLALRPDRDSRPALEQANVPLQRWEYLDDQRVKVSMQGEFPVEFGVRTSAKSCHLQYNGKTQAGRLHKGVWMFALTTKALTNAELTCR
mgnify:CR=1 FL=1